MISPLCPGSTIRMSAHLKFFELEQSPFEGKAQSQVVLGTRALRDAFAMIRGGLEEGDSRICVSGGPGLGKTSLARALPKLLRETARVAIVLDPDLSWESSRGSIAKQWGVASGGLARAGLIEAASHQRLVLVIDQAERASEEFLDHLDVILSYRSESDEPVVQSVLLARLSGGDSTTPAPIIWWLDRIHTLQLEFAPLPRNGIESYIQKHLKRAGWQGDQLFSEEAAFAIHGYTGGIPGEISKLCERLLAEAAERDHHDIDAAFVDSLCGENHADADEIVLDVEADADVNTETNAEANVSTHEDEAETIELQEVVSEPDTPPTLAESLEHFDEDENVDEDEDESDDVEGVDEADETDEPTGIEEREDEEFPLSEDALSAPASPEELRAIVGSPLGRQARAFAAAAMAAVIGGLAFVWLTADGESSPATPPDRREMAGFERVNPLEAPDSAFEGGVPQPVLARLRGPVTTTSDGPVLAEPEPEPGAEPAFRLGESEALDVSDEGASPLREEDGLEDDFVDMRPAAMIPDASGKTPFEKRFH